jgi:hypothetical protein
MAADTVASPSSDNASQPTHPGRTLSVFVALVQRAQNLLEPDPVGPPAWRKMLRTAGERQAVRCLTSIPTSCWVTRNGRLAKNRVVSFQGFLANSSGVETVIGCTGA